MGPISTIRERLMLSKLLQNARASLCGEAGYLETIVHAGYEKVVLALDVWVPFDPPNTTFDVELGDGSGEIFGVKDSDDTIIAGGCSEIKAISARIGSTYLPTAIREGS